jgi:predicted MFS family arabinose efflux permease
MILLTLAAVLYQLDRNIVFVTQELFKAEFGLSDTQVGMISGLAYGAASGLAALPMGWLIDRTNRTRLLGACITLWSIFTAACGMAGSNAALFAARVGVGISEAGGTPGSMSIVSDIYPPARRASNIGIISAGFSLGVVSAMVAGAFVADGCGWRAAFLLYGLPGVVVGLLMMCTLKEPKRSQAPNQQPIGAREAPLATWTLLTSPGLASIFLATALTSMVSIGTVSWWASFMIRLHGLSLPTVGIISMFTQGIAGIVGMLGIGFAADWARKRKEEGPLLLVSGSMLVLLAAFSVAVWTSSTVIMVAAMCIGGLLTGTYVVPRNLAISELAPPHLRGLAFTIPAVIANLVGAAMGPLVVGIISDTAARLNLGVEPLRIAITCLLILNLPVAYLYYRAALSLRIR